MAVSPIAKQQIRNVIKTYSTSQREAATVGASRTPAPMGDFRWPVVPEGEAPRTGIVRLLRDVVRGGGGTMAASPSVAAKLAGTAPLMREDATRGSLGVPAVGLLFAELLLFGTILWTALRTITVGLFGFGIPLEAVEYPRKRGPGDRWDWSALDSKDTIVIGAPYQLRREILGGQAACGPTRIKVVDLCAITDDAMEGKASEWTMLPDGTFDRIALINLELLMRDSRRRLRALRFLELLADEQDRTPGRWIVLLADLSPLERLMQRYETEAEELQATKESANAPPDARGFQEHA